MKKILVILVFIMTSFGIWKYLAFKSTSPSIIRDAKDTIERTTNYIPDTIDQKKQAEIKINTATQQENEQLKRAMEQLQ